MLPPLAAVSLFDYLPQARTFNVLPSCTCVQRYAAVVLGSFPCVAPSFDNLNFERQILGWAMSPSSQSHRAHDRLCCIVHHRQYIRREALSSSPGAAALAFQHQNFILTHPSPLLIKWRSNCRSARPTSLTAPSGMPLSYRYFLIAWYKIPFFANQNS